MKTLKQEIRYVIHNTRLHHNFQDIPLITNFDVLENDTFEAVQKYRIEWLKQKQELEKGKKYPDFSILRFIDDLLQTLEGETNV